MRTITTIAALLLAVFGAPQVVHAASQADKDWKQLMETSGPRPKRLEGESSLAYFMRTVELTDLRRRELGLKFWDRYPGDPRRYKWLLVTVNLPPHYPADIRVWAENETHLGPNTAAVDTKAAERWFARYPAMREQYWNSPGMTRHDRRYLWFGELKDSLRSLEEAAARKEKVDARPVLEQIVAYYREFPKALSETDFGYFVDCRVSLIDAVTRNTAAFGLAETTPLYDFFRRLISGDEDPMTTGMIIYRMQQNEGNPPKWVSSEAEWQFSRLPLEVPSTAGTFEGQLITYYQLEVNARKFRGIGQEVWRKYPDHKQRLRWLNFALSLNPKYYEDFGAGIHAAVGVDVPPAGNTDPVARAEEWDQPYAQLRAEIWKDPATTDQQRASLRGNEVQQQLWATWRAVRRGDRSGVPALLTAVKDLYNQYPAGAHAAVERLVSLAWQFGLDDTAVKTLLTPMLKSDREPLRQLAEAKLRIIALREKPLELKAPTLAGEMFDMQSLHGKVVLVDFWATTCASCIAAMPDIKKTYDRYRSRGFEVVSVCLDANSQRPKVERAKQEMGLTWTTLAADSVAQQILERYGYVGVPQYMLLDRSGRLVADSAQVDMGRNLPKLLDGMLDNP